MTNNEINFCYTVFCKYFEGKTYKNVITNGFSSFENHIIKLSANHFKIHDNKLKFYNDDCMFYSFPGIIKLNLIPNVGDPKFETIKEFLDFFNITLKDIV